MIACCLLIFFVPQSIASNVFEERKQSFRQQAMEEGIPRSVLDQILSDVSMDTRVIEKQNNQPEFTMEYSRYRELFITEEVIARGKDLKRQHIDLLKKLEQRYGVPSQILLAIWGIESKFGRHQSQYDVVRSISTLAFGESGRSDYFERELMSLLKSVSEGYLDPSTLNSSWAGAMGDPQFMPSSYMQYAVDYDADGKRDLWDSEQDILASIANFLADNGWESGLSWGKELTDGSKVSDDLQSNILRPDGTDRQFLTNSNFDVLKRYNPSRNYALTVAELSEKIGGLSYKEEER